ncbi:uncharacterized protein LOC144596908 [Rhinoraja longicauda]
MFHQLFQTTAECTASKKPSELMFERKKCFSAVELLPYSECSAGDSGSILTTGAVCTEFARSTCVGFLRDLRFPPTLQRRTGPACHAPDLPPVVQRGGRGSKKMAVGRTDMRQHLAAALLQLAAAGITQQRGTGSNPLPARCQSCLVPTMMRCTETLQVRYQLLAIS